jgi:hypothetical protein
MKTSGVAEPPEISVASVARLVSVSVGADTSVTWMFGYTLLKAAISVVRVSPCELVVMGLADHTIEPDVAEPAAADVPLDGELVLVLALVLLVLLLLLQAPRVTVVAAARAISPKPPLGQ